MLFEDEAYLNVLVVIILYNQPEIVYIAKVFELV